MPVMKDTILCEPIVTFTLPQWLCEIFIADLQFSSEHETCSNSLPQL